MIVLSAVALYMMVRGLFSEVNYYDEGVVVAGALRVANGELPQRDFWTLYPFGGYVLLSVWWQATSWLIEPGVLSARILTLIEILFLAYTAGIIVKPRHSDTSVHQTTSDSRIFRFGIHRIIVSLTFIILLSSVSFWLRAIVPALICVFALVAVIRSDTTNRLFTLPSVALLGKPFAITKKHITTVILVITCSIFRIDMALYLCIVLCAVSEVEKYLSERASYINHILRIILKIIVSTGFMLIAHCLLYFIVFGMLPIQDMYEQLLFYPLTGFPSDRGLPVPFFAPRFLGEGLATVVIISVTFYSTITAWCITSYHALWHIISKSAVNNASISMTDITSSHTSSKVSSRYVIETKSTLAMMLLPVLMFNQARVRCDTEHTIPMLLCVVVFCVYCMRNSLHKRRRNTSANETNSLHIGVAQIVVLGMVLLISLSYWAKGITTSMKQELTKNHCISLLQGIDISSTSSMDSVIAVVKSITPEGSSIFSGCSRHDKLIGNNILLPYICDRTPVGKYHELHPGIATTLSVQQEIVHSMILHKVPCCVLYTTNSAEPNSSSVSSGITVLDTFIKNNYTPYRVFNNAVVWRLHQNR